MPAYGTIFRDLLAFAPDAVIVVRDDGHIEEVNHQATAMFGYAREELVGQSIELLIPAGQRDRHRSQRGHYMRHPRTRPMGESLDIVACRKDGTVFPADIKLSPVQTEAGTLIVSIVRDVTDSRRAERQLQEYARTLAEANRELDEFAHSVAHDLKGPLKAVEQISVWIEEDLEDRLDPDVRDKLVLLRERIRGMHQFIEAMLAYARAGRAGAQREPVAVGPLVREVIDSLGAPAPFRFVIADGLPTLVTERVKLAQVFQNLLGNAVKYHDREDGCVRVSAADAGPFWEFTVRDDGPGITPDAGDRIFLLFERAARDREGSGVGLAIVKRVVETHGGVVTVHSEPGRGTEFRFTWPKRPLGEAAAA